MSEHLQKYAHIPLKQLNNRVWRTYEGGALIDRWKKTTTETDGSFPEEWIMSAVTARGNNRPDDEGLSLIATEEGEIPLKDLINSNLELYLGKELADKFGTTGVLIKMLDSKERLTVQVHPDKEYAKTVFNSEFGKTESWYVLNTREIDGEKSVVYMGFKKHVTRDEWKKHFEDQNIEGMLNCLHKIEVKAGDAFMIYGGVPHAIGSGCFLMEVQEPTDYTMRVEKTTPNGLKIGPELIHQGVGEEKMLECFHYDNYTLEEALTEWKIIPEVLESSDEFTFRTLFNKKHTNCFGLNELLLNGKHTVKSGASFYVAVIYSGDGVLICEGKEYEYTQGDEIFISAAISEITYVSKTESKILLCYPPN
ncbi:class I mannose-6-phosphate isomerase [Cellulophaga baltica]|uniref:type I phosphomannose isomerase catalytic subunit n=1 Tax=Cellulophaga TaxID=104264 RepID=UPI001C06B4A4|nr:MULTISPECIES: type I phosphomannose isomerase catalytic subunit [Cellulophaga]MBU2997524.1 class I mannose-6-phosphate isomerase [Cellulophaga baltica]MDO6768919.1 class I mannose-6-phosphate isomerase [Cellulophaga sp. 1_MG-2023]